VLVEAGCRATDQEILTAGKKAQQAASLAVDNVRLNHIVTFVGNVCSSSATPSAQT